VTGGGDAAVPCVTGARVHAGEWQAILTCAGAATPQVEAFHDGLAVPGVAVAPLPGEPGRYVVRVPIPAEIVSDGLQTLLIRLAGAEEPIGRVAVIAGAVAEGDLRAEIDLLRAELDLLKRAFRRHCRETAGPG
jgi:hypothetical protein